MFDSERGVYVLEGGVLQRSHAFHGGLLPAPHHGAHLLLGQGAAVPPPADVLLLMLLLHTHEEDEMRKSNSKIYSFQYTAADLLQSSLSPDSSFTEQSKIIFVAVRTAALVQ
jgi:hypothetical protein